MSPPPFFLFFLFLRFVFLPPSGHMLHMVDIQIASMIHIFDQEEQRHEADDMHCAEVSDERHTAGTSADESRECCMSVGEGEGGRGWRGGVSTQHTSHTGHTHAARTVHRSPQDTYMSWSPLATVKVCNVSGCPPAPELEGDTAPARLYASKGSKYSEEYAEPRAPAPAPSSTTL